MLNPGNLALPSSALLSSIFWYLEDRAAHGDSDRTIEGKRSRLCLFSEWSFSIGCYRASDITLDHLEAYLQYLHRYRQPRNGRPLQQSTKRNRVSAVTVFLQRLQARGIISTDPTIGFELPRAEKALPKGYLTTDEVERVMAETKRYGLKGVRDRAILETLYTSGIRRMELARLDLADIDLQQGLLDINQGKCRKDRRVPIALRGCAAIQLYLASIRPILATLKSGEALFLDNRGLRFRGSQLTRIAGKYLRRSGVRDSGGCNVFRHTAATLMHENGADLRHIQQFLGHAEISTTTVYTHVALPELRKVYARTHPAAIAQPQSTSDGAHP